MPSFSSYSFRKDHRFIVSAEGFTVFKECGKLGRGLVFN